MLKHLVLFHPRRAKEGEKEKRKGEKEKKMCSPHILPDTKREQFPVAV